MRTLCNLDSITCAIQTWAGSVIAGRCVGFPVLNKERAILSTMLRLNCDSWVSRLYPLPTTFAALSKLFILPFTVNWARLGVAVHGIWIASVDESWTVHSTICCRSYDTWELAFYSTPTSDTAISKFSILPFAILRTCTSIAWFDVRLLIYHTVWTWCSTMLWLYSDDWELTLYSISTAYTALSKLFVLPFTVHYNMNTLTMAMTKKEVRQTGSLCSYSVVWKQQAVASSDYIATRALYGGVLFTRTFTKIARLHIRLSRLNKWWAWLSTMHWMLCNNGESAHPSSSTSCTARLKLPILPLTIDCGGQHCLKHTSTFSGYTDYLDKGLECTVLSQANVQSILPRYLDQ
jgi:hypothetical protein